MTIPPAPPGFENAAANKQSLRAWARGATKEHLRDAMDNVGTHHAGWQILDFELRHRHQSTQSQQMESLLHDVADMRARLRSSEWKTWTLWFALLALVVTFLALWRDYFDYQAGDSKIPPAQQATAPTVPTPSDSPSKPSPVPPVKNTIVEPSPSISDLKNSPKQPEPAGRK